MRPNSGPKDSSDRLNWYCRQCGAVMLQKDPPTICRWCGNDLTDEGFGISGDNGLSETSVTSYAGRGEVIVDVDKPFK